MLSRVPPSLHDAQDLEILIRANHSLILLDSEEPERAEPLVRWVADRLALPFVGWAPDRGLFRHDLPSFEVDGSSDGVKCLEYVLAGKGEVNADDVGPRSDIARRRRTLHAELLGARIAEATAPRDHRHAERTRACDHLLSDSTSSDHSERATEEPASFRVGLLVPLAGAKIGGAIDEVSIEGEDDFTLADQEMLESAEARW